MKKLALLGLLYLIGFSAVAAEKIDASDPTKISSFVGVGYKYTDYTNGKTLNELRAKGNIGLTANDMFQFEFGFGGSDTEGDISNGITSEKKTGITNARARWFHLFKMEPVVSGFRGWASQIDFQIAGNVPGTNNANILAAGGVPAFGLTKEWSMFLPFSAVINWDKDFDKRRGSGISFAPLWVYKPQWWDGSYVQIWPAYTRFVEGELSGEGGLNVDLTTGGKITDTILWQLVYQHNFDADFNALKYGVDTGYGNDRNIYALLSFYF